MFERSQKSEVQYTHYEVLCYSLCQVLKGHPPAEQDEKREFEVFAEFVVFVLEFTLKAGGLFDH